MKAIYYESFGAPIQVGTLPDPTPPDDGVVVAVKASGLCRSDWHGWQGHDPDITTFPHVPGHELAGVIAAVGKDVTRWKQGDRVTVPFVSGCGTCPHCAAGDPQVCDNQYQPGFTGWGSFAELVALRYADANLVAIPEDMPFAVAAVLGCRFGTAFRAVVDQGRVQKGEWVAVHGCGGVGLSAVLVARAHGARVIAVDINPEALAMAELLGADVLVNANDADVPETIRMATATDAAHVARTGRGADLSLDALGGRDTGTNSILCLRKRGRHVQVGLVAGDDLMPPLPMHVVIAGELELIGSHGIQATRYDAMLKMIADGRMQPELMIRKHISLDEVPAHIERMDRFTDTGVTVIDAI